MESFIVRIYSRSLEDLCQIIGQAHHVNTEETISFKHISEVTSFLTQPRTSTEKKEKKGKRIHKYKRYGF